MKILYGIQGTGNGHLARARALVPELRALDIELDFIFSGRAREDFFNMQLFGDDWRVLKGASLVTQQGRLDTLKTIKHNNFAELIRDIRSLDVSQYDLVLSDFEPVTAWAAKLAGKTSLSISHQAAFFENIPKVSGYRSAKMLMRYFAPTDHAIGLHWHHFGQSILPPLIEPLQASAVVAGKYVVYMGFEAIEQVVAFLRPFDSYHFEVFAKVPHKMTVGHIQINPLSHSEFHAHLLDAEGVISNAGFELASECLHLGKKLLVKPLAGQFEQLSNALALQAMSRATVMQSLDQAVCAEWLLLPPRRANYYPNVAKTLAAWLLKAHQQNQWSDQQTLVDSLWLQLEQPYHCDYSFGEQLKPGLVI
ncbi:MAG: glycosyltransferase [Pseudomonadales bacterium]|nr:glycosyltransferase [Pseudomonadales bacterium]